MMNNFLLKKKCLIWSYGNNSNLLMGNMEDLIRVSGYVQADLDICFSYIYKGSFMRDDIMDMVYRCFQHYSLIRVHSSR